jgi:S-adenosylmethionine:tRNA ribosyltransferase-isomerase
MFSLSDYFYTLPEHLIAQEAVHPHHDARMMAVDRESGQLITETNFWNLDHFLGENRVLFFNDSKVLRSRIPLADTSYTKADGTTGILKEGEIFFLKNLETDTFEALVRPWDKFKVGTTFTVGKSDVTVVEKTDAGRIMRIHGDSIFHLMEQYWNLPLPPYIEYSEEKEQDYQTSFAKNDGSVAAPTASLHFTNELLTKISNEKKYITLHVGLGTFKGIDTTDIRDYAIHEESVEIPMKLFDEIATMKQAGQKCVAVGTTVCRTLESLPYAWKLLDATSKEYFNKQTRTFWDILVGNLEAKKWIHGLQISEQDLSSFTTETGKRCRDDKLSSHHTSYPLPHISFSTSIYITPGYEFKVVDDLITNFHLPESSLLVLVSAFLWHEETMTIYHRAIQWGYRFYSFGDGLYIRWK